jgi:hypothetical protein
VHDFAWWSGLTVADGRRGLEALGPDVEQATVEGKTYWTAEPGRTISRGHRPIVHLLPNYDEHIVAYRDHGLSQHPDARGGLAGRADLVLGPHHVVINGLVVGGWRRSLQKSGMAVQANLVVDLTVAERMALSRTAERYGRFLGLPVALRWA